MTEAQRWVLGQVLDQYDQSEAALRRVEKRLTQEVESSPDPFGPEVVKLLETSPGVGETVAQIIVGEIGVDMERFPTDHPWRVGRGGIWATMRARASARVARRAKGVGICGRRWCKRRGRPAMRTGPI